MDNPRLSAAIEAVYERFAAPTPRVIEGCPCCLDTRRTDELLRIPLRQLTGDVLWRYVTGAFLTVGGERDFRYLLPRILDLAVRQPGEVPYIEIILGKLRLAGWYSWSAKDREVVETLIDAWFDQALAYDLYLASNDWGVDAVSSVLCGAALADLDISIWLDRLRSPANAPVWKALVEWESARPNAFWRDAPEGWRTLLSAMSVEQSKTHR